jgi:3-methyladenine DNA glycosylase AlkC
LTALRSGIRSLICGSLKYFIRPHNHPPSTAIAAYPAHRSAALPETTRALISNLSSSGLPPAQILTILRKADHQGSQSSDALRNLQIIFLPLSILI